MKEHLVDCPKCQGTGKVTRKYIILKDETKKYCPSCENILDRTQFYKKGNSSDAYCKGCKNNRFSKTRVKKHELKCEVCGKVFFCRRKEQISCSKACHAKRMNYYRQKKLNNSLIKYINDLEYE